MIENVLTYPAPADSRFSRKSFHRGFFSLLLTALLLLGALAPGAAISARADEVTSMKIYRGRYYDATPFQVSNMFPGDREENRYTIRISYKGDLTLHFQPEIRPGSEKLAEVLRCRIRIEDETVYEGLLRDAPLRMRYELSSQRKTVQTVAYDITVWMDTSAGNEYKNQKLLCDFYFRDIEGSLGNHLEISICNEQGAVLFSGKMADMTRSAVQTADDILAPGKIRNLTISFHLPE